jgi:CHAT domain-containing protein
MFAGCYSRAAVGIAGFLAALGCVAAPGNDLCAGSGPASAAGLPLEDDPEALSNLAIEGRVLYFQDDIKLAAERYCDQAVALAERGEFRESIRAASKVLYLGQEAQDDNAVAVANRDLAIAYNYAGDLDHAQQYACAALTSRASPGKVHAPALKVLGDVSLRRGDASAGVAYYQKALALASEKFGPLVRLSLANAHIQLGNLAAAEELYRGFPVRDYPALKDFYRRGVGDLRLAQGDAEQALKMFAQSFVEAAGPDADYHRFWAQRGIGRSYRSLGHLAQAAEAYGKAIAIADAARARFRSEEFKTGLFGDIQSVYEEAIGLFMAIGKPDIAFEISEKSRSRALLDLVRERVTPRDARIGTVAPRAEDAPSIHAQLKSDEAIVQFHTTDKQIYAWVLRTDDLTGSTIEVTRKDLTRMVESIIATICGGPGCRGVESVEEPRESQAPRAAIEEQLHHLLIAPLGLRSGERLIIVPHGPLHYLPFQALRGADGYLIQHHSIAIEPSSSIAVQLLKRQRKDESQLLALANPKRDDVSPLAGAEREALAVSRLFKSGTTLTGPSATKMKFTAGADKATVIHIAAHAKVDKRDPLYSTILLTPDGKDRGYLEAREIFDLNLTRVSLATLSACSSGLGKIVQGDETLGFTRSFLAAGASSLIVSLWPVADDSTEAFMSTLYVEWAKGADLQQAMQKAQVRLLNDERYAAPFRWAPFNLVGNWRQTLRRK